MIEIVDFESAAKSEIAKRLARAKNIELTDMGVRRVSELARELVGVGMSVADAYNTALHHKFITEPSSSKAC